MARSRRALSWLMAASAVAVAPLSPASAEDATQLRPLAERPALMARSRTLSKPVVAPQPVTAPAAVPNPKARPGTDDDSVRPIDPAGISGRPR